jgi:hypothetical protein
MQRSSGSRGGWCKEPHPYLDFRRLAGRVGGPTRVHAQKVVPQLLGAPVLVLWNQRLTKIYLTDLFHRKFKVQRW